MARLAAQSAVAATAQDPTEAMHQKKVKADKTKHAKKHHSKNLCICLKCVYFYVRAACASRNLSSADFQTFVLAGALQKTSSTCTFGNGRELSTAVDSASHSSIQPANAAAWSQQERAKLNELYSELGRPHCSRGASSVQEHLRLYSIRYRMTYPERTAAEVVARVAHMIKYNQVSVCFCCYYTWLYLNDVM
jgi:hypothetical protein